MEEVIVYSVDFKEKIISIYEKQKSLRKTAALFGASFKFVQNVAGRRKAEESIAPEAAQKRKYSRNSRCSVPEGDD